MPHLEDPIELDRPVSLPRKLLRLTLISVFTVAFCVFAFAAVVVAITE